MSITIRQLLPAVLLSGLVWSLAAQTRDLTLGTTAFVTEAPPSPVLQKNIDPELADIDQMVGGVAFTATAKPGIGLGQEKLALFYNPSKPDGERLVIQVGERLIRGDLPDWLLIPIAHFADSEFNACISLVTSEEENNYGITYHSAFLDTLLGLRLLHADILLMKMGEYWDLPRFGGRPVVGLGELPPDEGQKQRALQAARELDRVLALAIYDSWLLTDNGEEVIFTVDGNGSLKLTGDPYFFFWKADYADYHKTTHHFETWAESLKDENRKYAEHIDRSNDRLRELSEERSRAISDFHHAHSQIRQGLSDSESVANQLDDLREHAEALGQMLDVREARGSFFSAKSTKLVAWHDQLVLAGNQLRPEVIGVEDLNAAMRERRDHLEAFNPVVYHAARQVMRFAAFFRYVKRTYGEEWSQFLLQVEDHEPSPAIGTPVQMSKPVRLRAE